MTNLRSHLEGNWAAGSGSPQTLVNPSTEEQVAETSAEGLDLEAGLAFARREGGAALAELSFAARGELLGELATAMHGHRDELLALATENGGNTRGDAKFDVDGASATFAAYAELGKELGDARHLDDGESDQIGRSPRLVGRHVYTTRPGVALLINAFNFPAWGFAEKAACALLAGMPVVVKPATSTAVVAHRMFEAVCDVAPKGALSMVCGSAHALPGLLGYGDVVAFTGSSDTGQRLRALPKVLSSEVRLNVEADSLNAAVLAPDVEVGSDTWDLFVRDVVKEVTQKTGQKCTAIRRIFVSESALDAVREALAERLSDVVVGDPSLKEVRMGPVSTAQQLNDVRAGIDALASASDVVLDGREVDARHADEAHAGKGYFVGPTLLVAKDATADVVHDLEVFGPVATIVPVAGDSEAFAREAAALVGRGRGGLVGTLYTNDRKAAAAFIRAAAAHHGRICLGSKKIAEQALSPGMALPQLLHGGPGRAGDGQELGGLRGLALYMQRTAVQGDRPLLDAIFGKG
jgi:oxepin-CoA hydrolase/3-oxo-5,6-dehydrosuberyl-CoA semialdehyde dehydrogenase